MVLVWPGAQARVCLGMVEQGMDLDGARRAVDGGAMDAAQVGGVLDLLLAGSLAEADGAGLLVAWADRGESADEVAAAVRHLRACCVRVDLPHPACDLCGTGGSGLTRFNVSTTAAFILAAAGVPVAKHGNLGSRRPNGSFDLLRELEVPFQLSPAAQVELTEDTGLCFLFARAHHPTVGAAAPYRKTAGCRTIFNLAGPLANPAPLACQLIGVARPELGPLLAGALARLGVPKALVVYGEPGIDEWSVVGATRWWQVAEGVTSAGTVSEALHPGLSHADLPGGDAPENALLFRRLLSGELRGPLRDMVVVNAGAALDLWSGAAPGVGGAGRRLAEEMLESGAAASTFERHRQAAQRLAATSTGT